MLILHGENLILSRQRLMELIQGFSGEVIRLAGGKITLTDLKQASESISLLEKNRLVVIENIFVRPASKEKESLLAYLKKNQPEKLIIWEGKKIDGRALTGFSFAKIQEFPLTAIVFKFLESLFPGNQKTALRLLKESLRQNSPEMVFFLLARHIKDLIIARDLKAKGLGNFPEWRKRKLINQAGKFELQALIKLYQLLLQTDYRLKTGQTSLSLGFHLDLLVANL